MAAYSDDFNAYLDGDLHSNAAWELIDGNGVQVDTSAINGDGAQSCTAVATSQTDFTDDQEAEIEIIGGPLGFDDLGIVGRALASGGGNYYVAIYEHGGGEVRLFEFSNGVKSSELGAYTVTLVTTDKIKIICVGTTISVEVDEGSGFVERIAIVNSTHTTGQPGVYYTANNSNTTTGDNFLASDVATPPTPAVYDTDLTLITEAESTTNWNALGGGGAGLSASPDLATQGTNCVDKQITNANKGQVFDNGSTTLAAGDHVFIRMFVGTPGLVDLLANEGVVAVIGSSTGNYTAFHIEGNDTYGAISRTGKTYCVAYDTTASGSLPFRTLYGTPAATPQVFGGKLNTTASVKGANLGVDVMRYGTGYYVVDGDTNVPANLTDIAADNDALANRNGVLTFLGGSAFELQGKLVLGQDATKTAARCFFRDADKSISLIDTPHSDTDFTEIIVDHAFSEFHITNIIVDAAGTNNKGTLRFLNSTTVVTITTCTFIGMEQHTLNSGVAVTGTTWRACNIVNPGGASLTNCVFEKSFAAYAADGSTLDYYDDCIFNSDGAGHAVRITGLGSGSMTWNSVTSDYALVDGSTGNETIFVDVGSGTLTINVASGASVPTIRTSGAVITVIVAPVTVKVTVTDSLTKLAIENADVLVKISETVASGLPYQDVVTITRSGTVATVAHTAHGFVTNNWIEIENAVQNEYNRLKQITVIDANSYTFSVSGSPTTPATGTILSTAVIINGSTDINGEISDTRTYSADQKISGNVAKGTSSPLYIRSPISTTVSKDNGSEITNLMNLDE